MLKRQFHPARFSLLKLLSALTILFVAGQLAVFVLHSQVSSLMDSLVNASIVLQLMHPVILWPVILFMLMQLSAYALIVCWLWFITISVSEWFNLSRKKTGALGILCWALSCVSLLLLNRHYFPHSYFAGRQLSLAGLDDVILVICLSFLGIVTLLAYVNFFYCKRFHMAGTVLLLSGLTIMAAAIYDSQGLATPHKLNKDAKRPNVILIGLDSLRPDFTHFYGNNNIQTPNIDAFLQSSTHLTQAYTPLARTFPAWISILTGKYPKHHEARNNLVNPAMVQAPDTLAKRLRAAGYETMYATDEKRFSNITANYGFDRILGPAMGVDDFLLGSLTDFPLSNLLVNLPFGRWLFPYNYGNRAAAITYQPDSFLNLLNAGLSARSDKPLFLVVHLCLAHWPFSWARDGQRSNLLYANQYASSVQGVDKQFGELQQLLQQRGLLKNSIVVLLSDHGTALGLPGDRMISDANYQGDKKDLHLLQKFKLSSVAANNKNAYTINTSYGQGTHVLSHTQYHVLLAYQYKALPPIELEKRASLIDIAPTILDWLDLPAMQADGVALRKVMQDVSYQPRSLFMETGDSISEIETDHIYVEKVLKHEIGIYRIDPHNGLLSMDDQAERGMIRNKQLAVMQGDWLLVHHPARLEKKPARSTVLPPYYVLANLKTGKWTIGLDTAFAKQAPMDNLLNKLKTFYGEELP